MTAFIITFAFLSIAALILAFIWRMLRHVMVDVQKAIDESDDEQNRF